MQSLTHMMSDTLAGLINRQNLSCKYSVEQQTVNIYYNQYFS